MAGVTIADLKDCLSELENFPFDAADGDPLLNERSPDVLLYAPPPLPLAQLEFHDIYHTPLWHSIGLEQQSTTQLVLVTSTILMKKNSGASLQRVTVSSGLCTRIEAARAQYLTSDLSDTSNLSE